LKATLKQMMQLINSGLPALKKVGSHQWSICVLFWLSTNLVFWFSLSVLRIHSWTVDLYTSSPASSWRLSGEENPLW